MYTANEDLETTFETTFDYCLLFRSLMIDVVVRYTLMW